MAAFPTAVRVGGLCRALQWRMIVAGLDDDGRRDYLDAVPRRLRMLL